MCTIVIPNCLRVACTTATLALLLSACASPGDVSDAEMAEQAKRCHFDETWSCVERMGHAERCFCADKDTLRELLEPTIR